jgi:hypothetical protein
MSKADHKICYYTRWFNECSIKGAADLTWFLASLLVCLFLVSLNNKIYKLKWSCHGWIGLQVSEVAEDSSINREWTRNNGWKKVDDDDDGSEEEEEDGDDDDDDDC